VQSGLVTQSGLSPRLPGKVEKENYMADFDLFLPLLLKFEGGYVNDPADPGGETNKGITMKTFKAFAQPLLGIAPTSANLKALTNQQAGVIYKQQYWDKIKGDAITLQPLANIVCDFYVNAGVNASKLLQRVLNNMGANLTVDGGIGTESLKALAARDQTEVYRNYKQGRLAYYQNLVQKNPKLGKFLKGWTNRVNSFPNL
jgi:lysozyme family protein